MYDTARDTFKINGLLIARFGCFVYHVCLSEDVVKARKVRSVRLPTDLDAQVRKFAAANNLTETAVIEAALRFFLDDNATQQVPALFRRLDKHQVVLERVAYDMEIAAETLATFVQLFLSVTPSIPEDQQPAARAQGKQRFNRFRTSVSYRLRGEDAYLAHFHDGSVFFDEFDDQEEP